ncbi:MAG: sensor histidine kinase [Sphaerochaetaceae bacterium]|jgi:two-component system sensor histidine kinase YesM
MSGRKSLIKRLRLSAYLSLIPVAVFFILMLVMLLTTTLSYDKIVRNITEANKYSVGFKEKIDYAMYRSVANASSVKNLMEKYPNDQIYDPYLLIDEARNAFYGLKDLSNKENATQIAIILRYLDNLEAVCRKVEQSAQEYGNYDENMRLLDLNVYILSELIQEQIQEYIHLEARSMAALRQQLYMNATNSMIGFFVVFVFYMIFSASYSRKVLNSIRDPIAQLRKAAETIATGDFSPRLDEDSYDEELHVLASSFNHMTKEIQELIRMITQEQQDLRSYELKLYQAQINPHFLYNTLDTIMALVESNMPRDALKMISYLSDFFRTTLSSGRDQITVEEEEQHIRSYLEIQHVRYQDILSYRIDFEDRIKHCTILKLTLQPIVENALYHGIKQKRGKGSITVTGRLVGGSVVFSVADDGIGMRPDEVEELRRCIHGKTSGCDSGFGLFNVQQRIMLHYGPEYGISVESQWEKGTAVSVVVPALTNTLVKYSP